MELPSSRERNPATAAAMIARVALDLVLRKEFDYYIPPALEGQVLVGSRVKVPFGSRLVLGSVTALLQESSHSSIKICQLAAPILIKVNWHLRRRIDRQRVH